METVLNWFAGLVLVLCVLFGVSCSTNKNVAEPLTPAAAPAEERTTPTAPERAEGCPSDRVGEPRQCKSTEDCCQGFECSVDPGLSRVVKYCLES
jgi:hypothetical protein